MAGVDLYGGHIKPYGETVFNNKMQGKIMESLTGKTAGAQRTLVDDTFTDEKNG
nr:late cornified envelope [White spot syndrome virus]